MAIRIYPLKRGSLKMRTPVVVMNSEIKTLRLNGSAEEILKFYGDSTFVRYIFDENKLQYFWIQPCKDTVEDRKKRAAFTPTYSAANLVKQLKNFFHFEKKKYIFSCLEDTKNHALKVKISNLSLRQVL